MLLEPFCIFHLILNHFANQRQHIIMLSVIFLHLWLTCLLTVVTRTSAQDEVGCTGNSSTYNDAGLVVPFQNLCGKDIGAVVDFLDPTDEQTWYDCMTRCVKKEPLCYGYDFRPFGDVNKNCWLMNATFDADTAVYPGYVVDAAMLGPDLLNELSDDCLTLGLWGCFLKNGGIQNETTSTSPAASSTTSVTSTPSASSITNAAPSKSNGLSAGAKGGIVAGIVAVTVMLVGSLVAFVVVRKRKQRVRHAPDASAAEVSAQNQRIELLAHKGSYSTAELASPDSVHELGGSGPDKLPVAMGELMGSSPERHELSGTEKR